MQTKPSQLTETVSRPTGIKMALLLFWEFIKLGAFTFGSGWSIIAQMEQEFVDKRHWVEQSDLLELIAVGKSLPGIMVANIVLLFGYQLAGPLGGILSAVGLCVPAVIVMTVVTAIYGSSVPWCPSSAARPSPWAKRPSRIKLRSGSASLLSASACSRPSVIWCW